MGVELIDGFEGVADFLKFRNFFGIKRSDNSLSGFAVHGFVLAHLDGSPLLELL